MGKLKTKKPSKSKPDPGPISGYFSFERSEIDTMFPCIDSEPPLKEEEKRSYSTWKERLTETSSSYAEIDSDLIKKIIDSGNDSGIDLPLDPDNFDIIRIHKSVPPKFDSTESFIKVPNIFGTEKLNICKLSIDDTELVLITKKKAKIEHLSTIIK